MPQVPRIYGSDLPSSISYLLKISCFLPVLHRGFGGFIIGAAAAFGHPGGGDFGDDVIHGIRRGFDQAGADDVADGADADDHFLYRFFLPGWQQVGDRQPLAIAADATAAMTEIDSGNLELFLPDI